MLNIQTSLTTLPRKDNIWRLKNFTARFHLNIAIAAAVILLCNIDCIERLLIFLWSCISKLFSRYKVKFRQHELIFVLDVIKLTAASMHRLQWQHRWVFYLDIGDWGRIQFYCTLKIHIKTWKAIYNFNDWGLYWVGLWLNYRT